MTSPIDAELAKCLERAKTLRALIEKAESFDEKIYITLPDTEGAHVLGDFIAGATNLALPIADDVQKLVRAVEEMREALKRECCCDIRDEHEELPCGSCHALARVTELLEGK